MEGSDSGADTGCWSAVGTGAEAKAGAGAGQANERPSQNIVNSVLSSRELLSGPPPATFLLIL